jgi:Tol biopolymer transport system component
VPKCLNRSAVGRERATPTPTTILVDADALGTPGNGSAGIPSISADGRYVAFSSAATNLYSPDNDNVYDVFVKDTLSGAIIPVSICQGTGQLCGGVAPMISADGRHVVFVSGSAILTSDTNNLNDVYKRDISTSTSVLISAATSGQSNGASSVPSVSADGSWVAFDSVATNLVAGDTNSQPDVFLRSVTAGTTSLVSVDSSYRWPTGPYIQSVGAKGLGAGSTLRGGKRSGSKSTT